MNWKTYCTIFFVFVYSLLSAQLDENWEKQLKEVNTDTVDGWKFSGNTSVNFAQSAFVNWAAGGSNSYALSGLVSLRLAYKKQTFTWENNLNSGYGFMVRGDVGFVKTDDKLDFDSKVGSLAGKGWYYAGLLNFKTQFTDGYAKAGNTEIISRLLAPAYLIGAIGIDKKFGTAYSLFIAPITVKTTFVMDKTLSDKGSFGVDPGEKLRAEAGAYVKFSFQRDLMENVNFKTRADFFSNYLHNPQNIDVNWESILTFKVNKYISASITATLIYDDDIKVGVHTNSSGQFDSYGPRTQFKEVLGIGFAHTFK
ncbi:MAG: DUF3078 domain-containing protein [Bacteroidetes bacterium]|nr:DUF3078 domain-containing protein [Bacteroidota bacterium]